MKHIMLLLSVVCCMMSCAESESLSAESELVVEGWIENDGYPVVMLTRTFPVGSQEADLHNLRDYLVKWAKVSVVCGDDTVVLTGKYDKGYYPPYVYTTSNMKGKTGGTYKLIVEYEDKYATAVTTIPPDPKIDTFRVERCAGSDTLYQITAAMTKSPAADRYYQFFTKVGSAGRQFFASFMGNIDESLCNNTFDVPVYRSHNKLMNMDYTPYFGVNDTVAVKCCNMEKQKYDFWTRYIETEYLSGAAMLSVSNNLPSNINGGVGYWFGYGATTSYFIIKDYAK